MTTKRKRLLMIIVQVVSATLAWRDLSRRSDVEIRGSKTFWKVFMALNPGNSLLYWLVGRRLIHPRVHPQTRR